jgi:DNA-binding MarR family transcriptional regulator
VTIHHQVPGTPTFTSWTIPLGGSFATSRVRVRDLYGESWPDVALVRGGGGGGELTLYAGGPEQLFDKPDLSMEAPFSGPFLLEDLNDDGFGDVAAVLEDGGILVQYLAPTPDGIAFAGTVDVPSRGTGTPRRLAAADLLGDGYTDLAVRARGNIFVYNQEDAPVTLLEDIPPLQRVEPGASVSINLTDHFADDHSPLVYRVVGDTGTGLLFQFDGQVLQIIVPEGWSGRAVIAVEAWDGVPGHEWTRSNDFVVFVNAPPRISSLPPTRTRVGDDFTYYVVAYDDFPEDDVVSYVLLRGPSEMSIDPTGGRLSWTPDMEGEYDILLAARDTYGGEDLQSFRVTVRPSLATPIVGPTDMMVAGLAALVGVLGAWSVSNENARFSYGLLLAPLYTKLKREKILQHFVRGQIYGYILANPGEHYNAIREALGLTNGSLAHHLRTLEREDFIKSKKFGLYRRFYPKNMRIPEDGEYVNEVRRTLLDIIRKRPGISQVELAHTMSLTPPTVNYHLGILAKAKQVRVVRRGRKTHCFVM